MVEIRPYRSSDLDALYRVSLATGLTGEDASLHYEDGKLIGQIYSAPYALLEPDLALVVTDAEGIAGYLVGVTNTQAWELRLEREWWPALRAQYAEPKQEDRSTWTPDQHRISMIFHPEPTPLHVSEKYPAHLHMNLLPRLQRRGVGAKLLHAWLALAGERGVTALHVGVNRHNAKGIQFWRKQHFVEIQGPHPDHALWMGRS